MRDSPTIVGSLEGIIDTLFGSLQGIFANAAVSSISPQVFLGAWGRDIQKRDRDMRQHEQAARGNEGGQGDQASTRPPHPGEVMEGVTTEGGGGWGPKTELVSMIVSNKMSHPGPVRVLVSLLVCQGACVRVPIVGR